MPGMVLFPVGSNAVTSGNTVNSSAEPAFRMLVRNQIDPPPTRKNLVSQKKNRMKNKFFLDSYA